jgi:hypothetical protein
MCPADAFSGADALVGARRRHADVGEHDIGPLGVDRGQQRVMSWHIATTSKSDWVKSCRATPSRAR